MIFIFWKTYLIDGPGIPLSLTRYNGMIYPKKQTATDLYIWRTILVEWPHVSKKQRNWSRKQLKCVTLKLTESRTFQLK